MVTRNDKSAHRADKPTKSELTRSGLLVGAAKEFSDRDYSDVTLNDIARRSGMTKGAVYFHFATKEEVAGAVSYIYDHRLRVLYAKVQSDYDDPHDQLHAFIIRLLRCFQFDFTFKAAVSLHAHHRQRIASAPQPFTKLITFLGERFIAVGSTGSDAERSAFIITSAIFGTQWVSWVRSDRSDLTERAVDLVRMLAHEPRAALLERECAWMPVAPSAESIAAEIKLANMFG
ncbi:TetR/AcrR family transcriptional regulator [Rhodococcus sp. 06-235-1A]|uniref:TetR/AcrR family transcriptional regulator n=1 Tax=Rhodococcus sp. 06-235-1A TaxID=2022508 RepID=UPI0015C5D39D|nr:TetR/AcrR family transcriptional regulator [Rhodococcus sp. 06-235-1A]